MNVYILFVIYISRFQGSSQPHSTGWARVPLSSFFLKFPSFFPYFPQTFLIFVFILVLRMGDLPIREGPGYTTSTVRFLLTDYTFIEHMVPMWELPVGVLVQHGTFELRGYFAAATCMIAPHSSCRVPSQVRTPTCSSYSGTALYETYPLRGEYKY